MIQPDQYFHNNNKHQDIWFYSLNLHRFQEICEKNVQKIQTHLKMLDILIYWWCKNDNFDKNGNALHTCKIWICNICIWIVSICKTHFHIPWVKNKWPLKHHSWLAHSFNKMGVHDWRIILLQNNPSITPTWMCHGEIIIAFFTSWFLWGSVQEETMDGWQINAMHTSKFTKLAYQLQKFIPRIHCQPKLFSLFSFFSCNLAKAHNGCNTNYQLQYKIQIEHQAWKSNKMPLTFQVFGCIRKCFQHLKAQKITEVWINLSLS